MQPGSFPAGGDANMISGLLLLLGAAAPAPLIEPDLSAMSLKDVRTYNANLSHNNPLYIRCLITPDTGSLIRKTMVCRTNHQWKRADSREGDAARETYDDMHRHNAPGSE